MPFEPIDVSTALFKLAAVADDDAPICTSPATDGDALNVYVTPLTVIVSVFAG